MYHFKQLTAKSTKVTSDTRTLIDHIATNRPYNVCESDVIPCGISNHDAVYMVRGMRFVHECSANFRSLFAHFLSKLPETAYVPLKIVIFLSFLILLYLSGSKFCPRSSFQFLANFHEYTLIMISYQATEAFNGYF